MDDKAANSEQPLPEASQQKGMPQAEHDNNKFHSQSSKVQNAQDGSYSSDEPAKNPNSLNAKKVPNGKQNGSRGEALTHSENDDNDAGNKTKTSDSTSLCSFPNDEVEGRNFEYFTFIWK